MSPMFGEFQTPDKLGLPSVVRGAGPVGIGVGGLGVPSRKPRWASAVVCAKGNNIRSAEAATVERILHILTLYSYSTRPSGKGINLAAQLTTIKSPASVPQISTGLNDLRE